MPKLPKELQAKKKNKRARVKGTGSPMGKPGASRAMRRQLQKQGIDNFNYLEDVKRVIIQLSDKELVIEGAQVIQLKQQGMTVHQIIGEPEERELGSSYVVEGLTEEDQVLDNAEAGEESIEGSAEDTGSLKPTIRKEDIMLVATQAQVSEEEAKAALEEADGDLARAILNLKTR
ncbi:MAG: nascent polypeptide-associated complex protein [Promethearchaeota archaeon]